MGKMNETSEDLRREEIVADIAAIRWNCEQRKSEDILYDREFLRDGKVVAIAEIKCRHIKSTQFKSYKVDATKLKTLHRIAESMDTLSILIVAMEDGVFWLAINDLTSFSWATADWERKDRNDPLDKDVCYVIPMFEFRKLSAGTIWEMT